MTPFAKRRTINTSILAALVLVSWISLSVLEASIRATAFWSGWVLLGTVVSLALFNARKKLPFLKLGTAATWMQFHAYAGLYSVLAYLAHAGFQLPQGSLEFGLCLLFALIAASGFVGLFLSRVIPVGLTSRGEPVLFERIPALRLGLQREVEEIIVECAKANQTTTISDFYTKRLDNFFRRPQNVLYHLMGWTRAMLQLEREIEAMDRYLNDNERDAVALILERAHLKDDLDYQWARQLVLKGWLFVHIPLTFSLLILAALHVFVVYGFRGNLP